MQWSDIQFNPSDRTLRQFAALCLIVFGAMALVEWLWRVRVERAMIYGAIALLLGPLGLIAPKAIKPVFVGWSVVAFPIGFVVSMTFLAILYFVVFTPIGLVFRLIGRDALQRRRRSTESYWQAKPAPANVREYFRQS